MTTNDALLPLMVAAILGRRSADRDDGMSNIGRERLMSHVDLGDEVRDTITGFEGVVVGITKWLHGCRRITVQPRTVRDGKVLDTATFDEPQIEVLKQASVATTGNTGGPTPEPTRAALPPRR